MCQARRANFSAGSETLLTSSTTQTPLRRGPPGAPAARRRRRQTAWLTLLMKRSWSLAVLVELARGDVHPGGARFVTLVNRLKVPRHSLSQTLAHFIQHDWVMHNPGYGHPLRPEYLLAEDGHAIAPACTRVLQMSRRRPWQAVALRKWSLPIVLALKPGSLRFGQVKSELDGITARALTMALKDLMSSGVIKRTTLATFPPATRYELTARGRRLGSELKRLVDAGLSF
jgi:DNA-binding HxlR family transcriptional regulator